MTHDDDSPIFDPHPDLRATVAAAIAHAGQRIGNRAQFPDAVAPSQVEILRECPLATPPQSLVTYGDDGSLCWLALVRTTPFSILALLHATRAADAPTWQIVGMNLSAVPPSVRAPIFGKLLVLGRQRITWGAQVFDPAARTMRIRLADGTRGEDTVVNASLLLSMPLRSPAAWADVALLEILDADNNVLMAERHTLS